MAQEAAMPQRRELSLRRYLVAAGALWTVALSASLAWNVHRTRQVVLELAVTEARAAFQKDLLFRRWNASHGGVYVPVSEQTPPNPHLAEVPGRDVTTTDGRHLTLVNPAYMTRQVHELAAQETGIKGHITSRRPLRAENRPDRWEDAALARIEAGAAEVVEEADLGGDASLRYMGRLITEERCLKCHARQGYRVGDVRGGISVAVALAPYLAVERRQSWSLALWHALIWSIGMAGLVVGGRRLSQRMAEREAARAALHEAGQQLARSRRLEAIGQLAGGLAHDLNNALAPILTLSGAALEELPEGSEARADMASVVDSALRARGLVRRMLAFARRQPLEVVPLDLSEVVAAMVPMVRDVLGRRVGLELALARHLPPVEADRGQVETLLVNLAANARDAMAGGGTLRVATAAVELDGPAARRLELQVGRHVELRVSDTGAGMSPEVLSHVFEPFFTTKEVGTGSGLGLASVHGLVKQHGGAIEVESAPGQGTSFRVLLPAGSRAPALRYDGSEPPSDSSAAADRSQAP